MTKSTKLAHALLLRDAALTAIRKMGVWETTRVGRREIKCLSAHGSNLHILYRTPFQQLPQVGDALKYRAALLGLTAPKNLPYGLDIWAPKKVLNIEWDDQGNVVLISFSPGAWELELITLAEAK
jgi:hypothetical protein